MFRRAVAVGVLLSAVLLVSLAARIPRPVSLPSEELNKLAAAHSGEVFRIYKPELDENDPVLSYAGAPNETAEVWLDQAVLTGSSAALFAPLASKIAVPAVYLASGASMQRGDKGCRTAITVRRASASAVPETLELAQRDTEPGDQPFRQLLLRTPGTALEVEVHTDSGLAGQQGLDQCPRQVRLGDKVIDLPGGPLYLLVPEGWVNLRFFSADPNHPVFPEDKDLLRSVSLGDDSLSAKGLDIVSAKTARTPVLHVQVHRGTDTFTVHDLKIAARTLFVELGDENERADAASNGTHVAVLNLPDLLEKNRVLGALAALLITGLLEWVRKTCFPRKGAQQPSEGQPS